MDAGRTPCEHEHETGVMLFQAKTPQRMPANQQKRGEKPGPGATSRDPPWLMSGFRPEGASTGTPGLQAVTKVKSRAGRGSLGTYRPQTQKLFPSERGSHRPRWDRTHFFLVGEPPCPLSPLHGQFWALETQLKRLAGRSRPMTSSSRGLGAGRGGGHRWGRAQVGAWGGHPGL